MSYRIVFRLAALAMAACAASTLHAAEARAFQVDTLKVEQHGTAGR